MDSLQSCGQGQSPIRLDVEVPSNWQQWGAIITLGLGVKGGHKSWNTEKVAQWMSIY